MPESANQIKVCPGGVLLQDDRLLLIKQLVIARGDGLSKAGGWKRERPWSVAW